MGPLPAILGGNPLLREPSHLVRPELPSVAELLKGLDELETTRMLTNQGSLARRLEKRIAAELDVEFCALFCNGTTAIMCLARALDLEGEVLLPSFTFAATAQALCWQGIAPRFVDIDPRTLMMDPQRAEEAITEKTSAIFPVNLFGGCCRYDAFEELSASHGLPLIFDSAQALGASYRGRPVGGFGDAEVLSFHATKVFHTAEGGAVVTNRRDLYERLCRIRNFGFDAYLNCTELGLNGKLDELSALLGLCLLDKLPAHLEARRKACSEYEQGLEGIPGLSRPEIDAAVTPSPAYFPLLVDSTAFGLGNLELNYALMAEGIVSRCYFYPPVHRTSYYQELLGSEIPDLPITEWAATSVLCLPLHSELETRTIQAIVEGIRRCRRNARRIREALRGKIPTDWNPESMAAHRDPYDVFVSNGSQPDPGDPNPKGHP